jgi:hypothetical protein
MRMYLFFSFIFFFTLSVLNSTDIQIATAGSEEDPDNIQETIQDDTVRMLIANEEFKMQIDELEELVEEDRLDEIPQIRDEQSAFLQKVMEENASCCRRRRVFLWLLSSKKCVDHVLFLLTRLWYIDLGFFFRKEDGLYRTSYLWRQLSRFLLLHPLAHLDHFKINR